LIVSKGGFRELQVWQKSKDLAIAIYGITADGKLSRDFGLREQMRRAAVSVCSNIAEGDERETDKESVRFFYIAKGSVAELIAQLEIAVGIGYLQPSEATPIQLASEEIARMLRGLISARSIAN
jgi:four helix bundle protein